MTPKFCPQCAGALEWRRLPDEQVPQPVCTRCGQVFWQNPKPTVSGLITSQTMRKGQAEVLLVRRAFPPREGCWDCPGGFIDPGEHPEEALRRELREELGVQVDVGPLVGIFMDQYGPDGESTLNIYYHVPAITGRPRAGSDAETVSWFRLDRLPDQFAFANNQQALEALGRVLAHANPQRSQSRARRLKR